MTIDPTATMPPASDPPPELNAALEEMYRRYAAATSADRVECHDDPYIVVVDDPRQQLQNPGVRNAVEKLARLGRKANMVVDLRGYSTQPTLADFGGSLVLRALAAGSSHVRYRRQRPLETCSEQHLISGITQVVRVNATQTAGRGDPADTGIFFGCPNDRAWANIRWGDQSEPARTNTDEFMVLVEVLSA